MITIPMVTKRFYKKIKQKNLQNGKIQTCPKSSERAAGGTKIVSRISLLINTLTSMFQC